MQAQLAQCVNKGMQRDYSMDKASQEFAYENKNIRITSTGNNSFLSITNERSTVEYDLIQVIQFVYSWENDIPVTNDIINVDLSIKVLLSNGEELTSKIVTEGTHSTLISNDIIEYINNNSLTIKSIESLDERYQFVTKYEIPDPNFMNNKIVLGDCTLGDYLVLFVKDTDTQKDIIYRLSIHPEHENVFYVKTLYAGNLNFDILKGIECIASYEADNVQKVYWVDGVNQPRYINICKTYEETDSFDFVPIIEPDLDVKITKEYKGLGIFSTGVIQYFITYYKKFGAESNTVYTSSLYYISPKNYGGEPNTTQTCSFNLNIKVPENNYDGIKVYSLIRSSLNTTPEAYLVYEGLIPSDRKINVVDTGKGSAIAPTDIQFLGGNTIIASTIEAKDNTLFLGDIKVLSEKVTTNLPVNFKDNINISFVYRYLPLKTRNDENYSYAPNLDYSSENSRYFKYKEWYRFGIQFETNTGEWGSPTFLYDKQCDLPLTTSANSEVELYDNIGISETESNLEDNFIYVPAIKCTIQNNKSFSDYLNENNIINWRIVVAEHDNTTRTIKAQGLVLPTIYNLVERNKKLCSYTPLWNMGLVQQAKHLENIEGLHSVSDVNGNYVGKYVSKLISVIHPSMYNDQDMLKTAFEYKSGTDMSESKGYFLKAIQGWFWGGRAIMDTYLDSLRVDLQIVVGIVDGDTSKEFSSSTFKGLRYVDRPFGQGKKVCKEIVSKANSLKWSDIQDYSFTCDGKKIKIKDLNGIDFNSYIFRPGDMYNAEELIKECVPFSYQKEHKITKGRRDRTILYSKNENVLKEHDSEYFFNANICNFLSPDVENVTSGLKFRLIGYTDIHNSISDYDIKAENEIDSQGNIVKEAIYNSNFNEDKKTNIFSGIASAPLWPYDNKMFWVYYWQHSGMLAGITDPNNSESIAEGAFPLKTKTFANMWYCNDTSFLEEYIDYPISDVKIVYDETTLFQNEIYKKKYENLLMPKLYWTHYVIGNETTPLDDLWELDGGSAKTDNKNIKTTSIKSDSSVQCVVDLGNYDDFQYILPNYRSEYDNNTVNGIIGEDYIRGEAFKNITAGGEIDVKDITLLYSSSSEINSIEDLLDVFKDKNNGFQLGALILNNELFIYGRYRNFEELNPPVQFQFKILLENISSLDVYENDDIININEIPYAPAKIHAFYLRFKDASNLKLNVILTVVLNFIGTNDTYPIYLGIETSTTLLNCEYNNIKYVDTGAYFTTLKGVSVAPTLGTSKLWIGEFYTDYEEESFMGGISENNIKYNTFIPVSGKYSMQLSDDNTYVGYGIEGDTYYQRWDHLRIFPISEGDVNRPIDALSIMVETHKNLDGDTRQLRGRRDVINLNEDNTNNVLNPVYSQSNNYLTYNILDDKFSKYHHPTMYIWSLSKQALADIDNWTQINLLSANELDGDKGALSKIKKWNNKLVAFQDKAIALINFNNQTTVSTSEGVPVEIANSGKVQGHYYFSTNNGCKNKWSIIDTPSGLYFIDSYNKAINLINEGISSLSTLHLLQDWINENEFNSIWQPNGNATKGFKTFYDPIHKEVYFVNGNDCLCYSELLAQFTSFYDYERLDTFTTINGKLYGIPYNEEKLKVYKMFDGDTYCNLFDKQVDYYMQYKINKDPFIDKTWTNVEYRADIFESGKITSNDSNKVINKTFDTLTVWDEYQSGIEDLSKAKNKFRIWRANIPRDSKNSKFGLDRIRNPWIMLELRKDAASYESTVNRMEFHDLVIKYLA